MIRNEEIICVDDNNGLTLHKSVAETMFDMQGTPAALEMI